MTLATIRLCAETLGAKRLASAMLALAFAGCAEGSTLEENLGSDANAPVGGTATTGGVGPGTGGLLPTAAGGPGTGGSLLSRGGSLPGTGGVLPGSGGRSTTATCTSAVQDGDETDVDCGGSCPACALGRACLVNRDCATHACTLDPAGGLGTCSEPVCSFTANCTCANFASDANVAARCQTVLDCYLNNDCLPTDPCATNNDGTCGVNKLGVDMGPVTAAQQAYACACR